ncbi:thiazole biosynthesis protein [Halanaeroarchaeum sulfurireducens]|uniref:Thiamine thiazole synthase n=1 Tax=Halanaeroarchaeum sulfurireducens TaxID=1604004 RepID=A0A0F7PBW1_9EURY|nr:FAD-dependent oxidoreductase [Halanaeroarchaeum sulfurireducens]AKH96838.1 ribulose-1,5-biphosphate synthetase [Halanaeroarchaeum sulfurireducens]ALG81240.1 ribulose-1,5-biphosphate synthetase [Halanaeroarchaeum sulfurireducens]
MAEFDSFAAVDEAAVTRAISDHWGEGFRESIESDVLIVGGGPSGSIAAKELAERDLDVVVLERENYLGGGFWQGGYLMNTVTFRDPSQHILDELDVRYESVKDQPGLFVANAPHATAATAAAAGAAGATIHTMTEFTDVVIRDGYRVTGAVINWTPVGSLPNDPPIDPVPITADVVIDASGHDAVVAAKLAQRGALDLPLDTAATDNGPEVETDPDAEAIDRRLPGHDASTHGSMWINESEDAVVEHTDTIHDGLIVTGMAVGTVFGLPRMGPTFGAMLVSGKRAARVALRELDVDADPVEEIPESASPALADD